MSHLAYIGLGSNLGDRRAALSAAAAALNTPDLGEVSQVSTIYETAPMYIETQPPFYNAVLALRASQGAEALLEALLEIEGWLGRERDPMQRYGPRRIDLDLLLFGEQQHDTAQLTLPHPRMLERRFVLTPLAELAPGLRHPVDGRLIATLERRCADGDRPRPVLPPEAWWSAPPTSGVRR